MLQIASKFIYVHTKLKLNVDYYRFAKTFQSDIELGFLEEFLHVYKFIYLSWR